MALADIDTIVIAIMENRSFDHMLGYLSLKDTPNPLPVEGLKSDAAWRSSIANRVGDNTYEPHRLPPGQKVDDPPHDSKAIALQISKPPIGPGPKQMGGFAASYSQFSKTPPAHIDAVMGYYDGGEVPTFDFFARHFCVCDHWFAGLPLGTQANRLMAMAGESRLIDNSGLFLPDERLAYDWLTDHKIPWCAYQSGDFLPFFSLMVKWLPEIGTSLTLSALGGRGRFRRFARFRSEWTSKKKMPNVIFVEPEYGDGPHSHPNDDHPPTGVGPGQELLADLYRVLTSNPARWAKTLLVVTYDEHGGFFDHVPPLPIETIIAGVKLGTTGVRVPAFLISPHVAAGQVFSGPLDHTSLLQLLDDRFAGGKGYSPAVTHRQSALGRISHALLDKPRTDIPTLPAAPKPAAGPGFAPTAEAAAAAPSAPPTPNAEALDEALRKLARDHPELLAQPGWEQARAYLTTRPPPLAQAPDKAP